MKMKITEGYQFILIYILLVSLPIHLKVTNAVEIHVSIIWYRYRQVPKMKVSYQTLSGKSDIGASLVRMFVLLA